MTEQRHPRRWVAFFVYTVKRLGATVSAAFLNPAPVTIIDGRLILNEVVMPLQLAGMGFQSLRDAGKPAKKYRRQTAGISPRPPTKPDERQKKGEESGWKN